MFSSRSIQAMGALLLQVLGRTHNASRWEMFKGQWIVLKCRVHIRHGRMSGIAGLGKKAQVSEAKAGYQTAVLSYDRCMSVHTIRRMNKHPRYKQKAQRQEHKEN